MNLSEFAIAMHNGDKSYRTSESGHIVYDEDLATKVFFLMEHISTIVPSNLFNRREIEDNAWLVADRVGDAKSKIVLFVQNLMSSFNVNHTQYLPCYAIYLPNICGSRLELGPVSISLTKDLNADLINSNSRHRLKVEDGGPPDIKDGLVHHRFPENCWKINLYSSKNNLVTEAIWMADVIVSFVRLQLLGNRNIAPLVPSRGRIELPSVTRPQSWWSGISVSNTQTQAGSSDCYAGYSIDRNALNYLNTRSEQALTILNPKSGTLAVRVAQGLGWMTRGRQSLSHSERLLYFFTSLEALLSPETSGEPVTQTIARHLATILTSNIDDRVIIAKVISDLYAIRSNLIHRGSRSVTDMDATKVQIYAEDLYYNVMEKGKLDQTFNDFFDSVKRASYGSPWPKPTPPSTP